MATIEKTATTERPKMTPAENQKGIENHKKAATHLVQAAKHHMDAANHHENDNHEAAAKSTVLAQGHTAVANEAQREN